MTANVVTMTFLICSTIGRTTAMICGQYWRKIPTIDCTMEPMPRPISINVGSRLTRNQSHTCMATALIFGQLD